MIMALYNILDINLIFIFFYNFFSNKIFRSKTRLVNIAPIPIHVLLDLWKSWNQENSIITYDFNECLSESKVLCECL